jgi:hypothetical protein
MIYLQKVVHVFDSSFYTTTFLSNRFLTLNLTTHLIKKKLCKYNIFLLDLLNQ